MNLIADPFFTEGCGRCPLGGTTDCKVHSWTNELAALRSIILSCGLTETLKWGVPCYTFGQTNVVLIGTFKNNCVISFFKGALLQDTEGILKKPGEHTQAIRVVRFTNLQQISTLAPILKNYIFEAIEVERAGLTVDFKQHHEPVPDELTHKFNELPALKAAFEGLTPGRQRAYLLHFSAPKQSKTRTARVEKCIPDILNGKGLTD